MVETAYAPRVARPQADVPDARRNPRLTPERKPTPVTPPIAAPVNNPIFKILFIEDLQPEERRTKLRAFANVAETKAKTNERKKAREEMEDYLEAERLRMQEELMRSSDTDTFSVLQGVLNDMNSDLMTFEEQIKPFTDILDAVYKLQKDGKAIDAFREISYDKRNEATRKIERDATERDYKEIDTTITTINEEIAKLGEEKTWFGLGGVKQSARQTIAVKMTQLDSLTRKLTDLQTKLEAVSPADETEMAEYAAEKAQMRSLLDISGAEHSAKQREIVDTALRFVATSKARVGDVRNHFAQMSEQMDHLKDANGKMMQVRAVMGEAMRDARDDTMTLRGTLTPIEGVEESLITKLSREENLEAVDEHVKYLDDVLRNNTVSLTDLERENIAIRTERDQHNRVLDKTRILHTQGIASVASRINTVLTAVSMAALQRSTDSAGQTMRQMADATTAIIQKEVMANAVGIQDMTADVKYALDALADIGKHLGDANIEYRKNLGEMHIAIDEAKQTIETVKGDINVSTSLHSEARGAPTPGTNGATPPAAKITNSPFDFGAR